MSDGRVPTTAEELVPVIQQEFENVAKQACAIVGSLVPLPDSKNEPQAFDAMLEAFGKRLAEAVAARPRPLACDAWSIMVDVRRVEAADSPKIDQMGLTSKWVVADGVRATLLFLPVLIHQGDEKTGLELLHSKYGGVGELVATVSVVLGLCVAANERRAVVIRTSSSGNSRWWSSGPMAADRSAKLGQWSNTDPSVPDDAKAPVKVTSTGSSMLN